MKEGSLVAHLYSSFFSSMYKMRLFLCSMLSLLSFESIIPSYCNILGSFSITAIRACSVVIESIDSSSLIYLGTMYA